MDPETADAPTTADDARDEAGRFLPGASGRPPGRRRVDGLARALAAAGVRVVVLAARPAARPRRPAGRLAA